VKLLWQDQEKAAIRAVRRGGRPVDCGRITWWLDGRFLYAVLPSGRMIAYPDPEIHPRPTPWGEDRDALTFMGVNQFNRQWWRLHTYGGSIVENLVQAMARDLMVSATSAAERSGVYRPVLTVHDELIAEADAGTGTVEAFTALMTRTPAWADGCPIAAEGWTGRRYRK
jgi:DNA polymerase